MTEKELPTVRMKNSFGESHLLIIFESVIPNMGVGTAYIVPWVTDREDPTSVVISITDDGYPLNARGVVIVKKYHFKEDEPLNYKQS